MEGIFQKVEDVKLERDIILERKDKQTHKQKTLSSVLEVKYLINSTSKDMWEKIIKGKAQELNDMNLQIEVAYRLPRVRKTKDPWKYAARAK